MKTLHYLTLILLSITILLACNEDDKGVTNPTLEVRLTDAPGNYEEVNIDIQDVLINRTSNSTSGWESIGLDQTGVYNLLEFTNGLDTLLGSISLPPGTISQLRLVLGPLNTVKVDGKTLELQTPSAQQSGLKLNINETLEEGITYKLILDFDVARSIVARGNDSYSLKPVIRTFVEATSGAVNGNVIPLESKPAIFAIEGTDTVGTTLADSLGYFKLRGLESGVYTISFSPVAGYLSKTLENVAVTNGTVTNLGTVNIEPQ